LADDWLGFEDWSFPGIWGLGFGAFDFVIRHSSFVISEQDYEQEHE